MKVTYELMHEINDDGVISHRILETAPTLLELIEASYKYDMEDRKIAKIMRWSDDDTVPTIVDYGSHFIHYDHFHQHLDWLQRTYPRPDISDENRAEIHYGFREAI